MTLVSTAALFFVIAFFVQSPVGQRIDETAYVGARIGRWRIADTAFTVLGLVTVAGIVAASAAVVAVAVTRRRVDLAVASLALVGGANVTTQALKQGLLERPDVGIETWTVNSLPSGHTTVVASLAAALLLVMPPRTRAPLAIIGAVTTTVTGIATLIVGWHRPSDIVAAMFVVAAWTGLVIAGLALVPRSAAGGAAAGGPARIALLLVSGLLLAASAIAMAQTATYDAIPRGRSDLFVAYLGGAAGIAGTAALIFAVVLALAPVDGPGRRHPLSPALVSPPLSVPPGRPAD